ncbi:hypothetical protein [Nitrosomonas supralitoralis]|uniref:Uncharacterized protein n=1 Tax=Nitrosomonas supralitoralis TaxID=2116706 RepID=A0A2P7NRI6_9PROT|nr:hypothetical protein [Nitrosomonas supralitoralis]PSJ16074.1 hypothetical protein C7H79_15455 [Nitrosomonas supralitoralis]
MIAAAPPVDPSLGLIQLIFSLNADQTQSVPEDLKKHLANVITEAKELLSDPINFPKNAHSDAIAFALWMKANKDLNAAVNKITTFETIDPTLAKTILHQMRANPGY